MNDARRRIFNQLVAPIVGGLVTHDKAKAMLDDYRDQTRREESAGALRIQAALLELHPKVTTVKHGCCAEPKVCNGHPPECWSRDHGVGSQTPWPCRTLRAAGITTDAEAEEVHRLVAEESEAA